MITQTASEWIQTLADSWHPGLYFHWPLMLLLLPLPLLWPLIPERRLSSESDKPQGIDVPPSLAAALQSDRELRHRRRLPLSWPCVLAWLALIAVLAQPLRPGSATVTPISGRAMVLAIDLSGSMDRQDFELNGAITDRLSVVQAVAREFIARRKGDRVGLVVFGKEAYIASPLTFDLQSLVDSLDSVGIGMAGRSTAIGDALGLSLSMLRQDPAGSKAVVLLSDGTNNAGAVEPEAAAELSREFGVRVHTIALGSEGRDSSGYATAPSADLDEKTLEGVAVASGGEFFRARTTDELIDLYAVIDELESSEDRAPPTRPVEDLRAWPLTLLFMTSIIIALRGPGT